MLASRNPAKIYITGRNEPAAQQIIADIKSTGSNTEVTFIRCDHADLASVKKAADDLSRESHLDVLMANAGVMALPPGKQFSHSFLVLSVYSSKRNETSARSVAH
jgi:NAD(P)-dependent dehydrogenase (short-subunit alcohol dehydrogenase family)